MTLLPTEARASAPSTDSVSDTPTESRRHNGIVELREHAPTVAVLAAVAWWLIFAARNWGGRGPHATSIGAGFTLVALVAARPDRYVGRVAIWLAGATSVAAFVVAAVAPAGWQGATIAAPYACMAWLVVAVAAETVRKRQTSILVAGLILIATLAEFSGGWTAWHGQMDPRVPFSGTFYWYNQAAAFMIPGAVIGLGFWLARRGPFALLGLLAAVFGSITVVYSTSRASLACLALALVIVLLLHLWRDRGLRSTIRAVAGSAVVCAGVILVAGPPFFPHRYGSFSGTASRTTGQSLGQNGGYRLDFWREAIAVFTHHPIVGSGYRALADFADPLVPRAWPKSPLAHNGFLQAFSDGGLVLGVPICVATLYIVVRLLKQLRVAIGGSDTSPIAIAVPVALGALLAHSFVDFDWSYSSLFAMTAVLAGLVLGWHPKLAAESPTATVAPESRAWSLLTVAVLAVGVATLVLAAYTARTGEIHLSVVLHGALTGQGG